MTRHGTYLNVLTLMYVPTTSTKSSEEMHFLLNSSITTDNLAQTMH